MQIWDILAIFLASEGNLFVAIMDAVLCDYI